MPRHRLVSWPVLLQTAALSQAAGDAVQACNVAAVSGGRAGRCRWPGIDAALGLPAANFPLPGPTRGGWHP